MDGDWEVSRTTGKCAATHRDLAEGEAYYAVLLEGPEGLQRRDYSLEAWTGPPQGSFCYWRGRVPIRQKKRSDVTVHLGLLMHLFCGLQDEESEMKQQFRFILALLLMRKRRLKFEKAIHDGQREYWQLRLAGEQSLHKVLNPRLTAEETDRLSAQLTSILSGEVESLESLDEARMQENQPSGEAGTDSVPSSTEAEGEGGVETSQDGPEL